MLSFYFGNILFDNPPEIPQSDWLVPDPCRDEKYTNCLINIQICCLHPPESTIGKKEKYTLIKFMLQSSLSIFRNKMLYNLLFTNCYYLMIYDIQYMK